MKHSWPAELAVAADVGLAGHTSWLVGGPAEFFAEPTTVQKLTELQKTALAQGIAVTILGGGTNVLVSDRGVKGLVISLAKLTGVEVVSETPEFQFWAHSGTPKSELLKIFLKTKLAPARFLAGLPGQTGGGVVMNAGISEKLNPREFREITRAVEVLRPDGSLEKIQASNMKWDYRHCEGWKPGVITRVLIAWPNKPEDKIPDLSLEVKKLNQSRLQKQPLHLPSCGSVFRNPLPQHAGQLIESAGLKGFGIGGAQISDKHANFIVNRGGATAADIKQLMDLCLQRVREKHQVELMTEVVWVGEPL